MIQTKAFRSASLPFPLAKSTLSPSFFVALSKLWMNGALLAARHADQGCGTPALYPQIGPAASVGPSSLKYSRAKSSYLEAGIVMPTTSAWPSLP